MITESGVRARSDNPRSRGPAPDLSRAQLPPLSTRRPRPARQTKHFIARGWTAVHADLSVFARALEIPVSSGLTTITLSTNGSRIRATSQQLAVTSNATRSVGNRLSANSRRPSGCSGPGPRSGPARPRRSRPHRTRDARPDRSHDRPTSPTPPSSPPHTRDTDWRENQRDNDTDRDELERSILASRRGDRTITRARSPSPKTAYPSALPQKAPIPDHPTRRSGPDRPSSRIFMHSKRESAPASSAGSRIVMTMPKDAPPRDNNGPPTARTSIPTARPGSTFVAKKRRPRSGSAPCQLGLAHAGLAPRKRS